jgi:hypothetical protein
MYPLIGLFYCCVTIGRSEYAIRHEREETHIQFWRENLQDYGHSERPERGGSNNRAHLIYVSCEIRK